MKWTVGQQVTCNGVDWGLCQVRMSNENMVVIYCPRYEFVMSGSPFKLDQAGWQVAEVVAAPEQPREREVSHPQRGEKVVSFEQWRTGTRSPQPVPVP